MDDINKIMPTGRREKNQEIQTSILKFPDKRYIGFVTKYWVENYILLKLIVYTAPF
jgi:hypothetical protein